MQVHYSWWIWQQSLQLNSHYYILFSFAYYNVAKLLAFRQIFFMPGVCLRWIFLRVMFLKNRSGLLQQWDQKKKRVMLISKKNGLSNCTRMIPYLCSVGSGRGSLGARWQCARLPPPFSRKCTLQINNCNCFCAGHLVFNRFLSELKMHHLHANSFHGQAVYGPTSQQLQSFLLGSFEVIIHNGGSHSYLNLTGNKYCYI